MKRWWVLGLLLVFLVAGCKNAVKGGETPQQTAGLASYVRSGTQGLQMSFVQGMPPDSIYDIDDLVIINELKNMGSYNIKSDKCFLELSGPTWDIVRGVVKRQSCGNVDGKSVFNTEGGFNQIEFKSTSIYLPPGVDKFSPNLVLSACYNYKTMASPQICVDSSFYQLTAEQKACQVKDLTLGGGQGAPVAITAVNVDMVGQKAIFEISISNVGGGRVISPRASLSQCPSNLRYDDFDEVRYTLSLSGQAPEKCTPQDYIARLNSNQGKIFCTFKVGSVPAYEAPLNIELNYNYLQSIAKKVNIIKTP